MLPLYKRGMRYAWVPYRRLRLGAVLGGVVTLLLLFLLFSRLSPELSEAPAAAVAVVRPDVVQPQPVAADGGVDVAAGATHADAEAETEEPATVAPPAPSVENATQAPLVLRLLLPLVAGFVFGFLGSVPVAGPTSAMVLKLGIQGKYTAGLTIAVGGAISEATYAGIAFWGFGSFLAGAKFLLPVSKVLGAIMFTLIGLVFLKADMKPSLDPDVEASHGKAARRPQSEVLKNILMGLTMSGINPALLASYTGAIASVYGTGMLEFTLFLAVVFAIGVCCGVSTWFYLLLSLLKKYKQRLKNHTIDLIMRGLGCFLLTLGLLCAKSSLDYFLAASPETK
ncbi:lysine exporter protein (lyse ygga) [Phytophthora cinnamomi]|uniref:lysine exporter protein (lyse ygga) n=1 Tax=Phytophthora cinnamomi TaxID=4785 RepID=UPI00355A3B11|nr:lysine exporter protein (lyse ygga) [Phytophthora cinnamomi]